ncbi:hypothetical protein HMPREF1981_03251 [Bacteroides pyogenes F0041]|uniref:Uncharacterized protein n=1 Tax=Bacteroides pyogenes F0041 TaxID=1321819 RepID=U2CA22_9BACE|nr:hypothetical protein HMPREF1981_03251 [Bacteroides pyogenes F0041]
MPERENIIFGKRFYVLSVSYIIPDIIRPVISLFYNEIYIEI